MSSRSAGFTLLEVLIALALFALLGLASWRMFDGLLRVERGSAAHALELRGLQRAVAVIERDALQWVSREQGPGITLNAQGLGFQRGNWRNPQDQPRSGRQWVFYQVEEGTLWRYTRSETGVEQRQALLHSVSRLGWRLHLAERGWQTAVDSRSPAPQALELVVSAGRYSDVRRVMTLSPATP